MATKIDTKFLKTGNMWVDAEFYFYGKIKDAGAKNKANIHLDTEDHGCISIETKENFLRGQEDNLLHKEFGIRVKGKQNIETGDIDTKSFKLIELIDYDPNFDSDYLEQLILKAKGSWKGIDADEWLINLRGEYES